MRRRLRGGRDVQSPQKGIQWLTEDLRGQIDADFARSVGIAVAAGDFAAIVGGGRLDGGDLVDAGHDFAGGIRPRREVYPVI